MPFVTDVAKLLADASSMGTIDSRCTAAAALVVVTTGCQTDPGARSRVDSCPFLSATSSGFASARYTKPATGWFAVGAGFTCGSDPNETQPLLCRSTECSCHAQRASPALTPTRTPDRFKPRNVKSTSVQTGTRHWRGAA